MSTVSAGLARGTDVEVLVDTAQKKLESRRNDEFAYHGVMVLAVVLAVLANVTNHGNVKVIFSTIVVLLAVMVSSLRQLFVIRGLCADVAAKDTVIDVMTEQIIELRDREDILRSQKNNGNNAVKALFKAAAAICHDRTDVGARKARDEAAFNALRMGIRIALADRKLSPSMTNIWAWAPSTFNDPEQVSMFADLLAHRKGDVKNVLKQEQAPDDIARYFLGLEAQQPS